jgi:hypothetical protein
MISGFSAAAVSVVAFQRKNLHNRHQKVKAAKGPRRDGVNTLASNGDLSGGAAVREDIAVT